MNWLLQWGRRLFPQGLERRAHDSALGASSPEELWPWRFNALLQPPAGSARQVAHSQRMA